MRALLAALLLTAACGAAYGSNGITTQQAFIAAPLPIDLSGATPADAGTSLSFIRADAERALTGQLPLTLGGTGYSTTVPTCTGTFVPLFTSTGLTCPNAPAISNPALKATRTSSQTINNSATTTLVFGNVVRDTDSAYVNTTGIYTIPTGKGGDYSVGYAIGWSAAPGATGRTEVFVSGSTAGEVCDFVMANATITSATAQGLAVARSCVQSFVAGETVQVQVTQTSGGSLTTASSNAPEFLLKRLGD